MNYSIRSITIAICTLLLCVWTAGCTGPQESKEIIYVGTFAGEGSEGLYVYEFDREAVELNLIQTVSDREGPNFQAIHPTKQYLYSISRVSFSDESEHHTVSAYQIDGESGRLSLINEQSVHGLGPAHVSVDPLGRFVYVANYAEGNLAVYTVREDGGLNQAADIIKHEGSSIHPRQAAPHVHAIDPSPDGRFIYVSDLGMDRVMIYAVDPESGMLSPADSPWFENTPGAGPRHFTFHPNGRFAYSAEELSSTVAVLRVDPATGGLEQIQRADMRPDGFEEENTAADIHVSSDGRFLYASNRGHDSLAIFSIDEQTGELSPVGHEPTRGGHPRNFMIDQAGEFAFVANRDNNNVVVFHKDPETGELTYAGLEIEAPLAVCVTQLIL